MRKLLQRTFIYGLLLSFLFPGTEAMAEPIEDCGLDPPGYVPPPPPGPKPHEGRVGPDSPPVVRREILTGPKLVGMGVPSGRVRSGALTGRTVYLSAGHGFTWTVSGTLAAWRTQRGTTNDIVEDLVSTETASQWLIPMLQNAGATVVPVREMDLNRKMTIVDEASPGYSEQGALGLFSSSTEVGFGAMPTVMDDRTRPFGLGATRTLTAAATSTAQAIWAPDLAADGYYNVYLSYAQLAGRVSDAHFVVKHEAGQAHFRVNQRRHGGTWVLLGRFYFRAGTHPETASVVAHNDSAVAGTVSLDAVRFGGGEGMIARAKDTTTAQVTSGRPRFEESARYHAQFAGAPLSVFDPNDDHADRTDDVGTRPRFAAWHHEDGEDAVYVAWHTNAFNATARGSETYVYGPNSPDGTFNFTGVPGSDALAQAIHGELIKDVRSGWDASWKSRGVFSANFGELNPGNNPEMPATLVEVAFHDAALDATQLKEPAFRYLAARAITQGIIRYFGARDGAQAVLPPEPPVAVSARNLGAGQVELRWTPAASDGKDLGGDLPSRYRVYLSADGLAWDDGTEVLDTVLAQSLTVGSTRFFRVAAVNAGGESFPSETVGVGVTQGTAPVLVVNGFDRLEAVQANREDLASYTLGSVHRVFVDRMNDGSYLKRHADALSASGKGFDGASNEAVVLGVVPLVVYDTVDWFAGRGGVQGAPPSRFEQDLLRTYVQAGGNLLISGSHLASGLTQTGVLEDRQFLTEILRARLGTGGTGLSVAAEPDGLLAGLSGWTLDDGLQGSFSTGTADPLVAWGAVPLAHYEGSLLPAALASGGGEVGKVVLFSFPLENVVATAARHAVMQRVLGFFDSADGVDAGIPDGGLDEPTDAGSGSGDGGMPGLQDAGTSTIDLTEEVRGGCGCSGGAAVPYSALAGLALLIVGRSRRRDR